MRRQKHGFCDGLLNEDVNLVRHRQKSKWREWGIQSFMGCAAAIVMVRLYTIFTQKLSFISEKEGKMRCKLGRNYVKFIVKTASLNANVGTGLLAFALKTLTCKMHRILVVQPLVLTTK
ncbi:hypothetical protein ANCDUO_09728 [Ancylostoma duodenale]|uniref:Uncharacterized protein n=1 Tax=Ancylostoma duodenale TaxID=51022 RepID=A0A0C2DC60_9BILA|nr:hypothetical protein ANCDUO_09728 [Ancylostoma duodenale]